MSNLAWRIYYNDGRTVTSQQAEWNNTPKTGLVAVVWKFSEGPVQVEVGTPYYLNMGDWICRVWDPGLYLRNMGVKFGRWAPNAQFQEAWRTCLEAVTSAPVASDAPSLMGGCVCATTAAREEEKPFGWIIYYDSGEIHAGDNLQSWQEAPTDGVLAVYHHHVLNQVRMAFGTRRFTHYYWKGPDLINRDFVEECLPDFPQFKYGCPAFTAKSYTEQARAIADAMNDTLEDL